ncbi:GNAT family N-acetyltransferase [Parapedobacter sp. GCM10030251]|uniref:GNAT family N-acetyltransferase n=1 Tax=Parapedobacter sp. GCM10030251 TaxID=3273419 RepID=UPI00361E264F
MMNIRKVTLAEVGPLQQIARQTFSDTFSSVNSIENIEKYLAERLSIDALKSELQNENSEFYFAEDHDRIVGYLKINVGNAQTERQEPDALEIERIYVLKEFQGKRVGQRLYQKAVEIAGEKNARYVWLGVWEENDRAIAFYKKCGFAEFDKHIFTLGTDEQTDIMMKLQLKE